MPMDQIKDTQTIVVSGHRGFKSAYPENTLLSFYEAIQRGADMLEFDLRMSKDKHIVIIHDETVDRTTNSSGEVCEFTLQQLQSMDAGGWFDPMFKGLKIPTFEELCEFLKPYPNLLFNIEIKPSPDAIEIADRIMPLLKQYGLIERSIFTSFDASVLGYLFDRYGLKTQGFIGSEMKNFNADEHNGTYSKMWAIGIEMKLLTPQIVERFKEMGLQVWSYCPDTMQKVHFSIGCGAVVLTCNNIMPALELRRLLALAKPE